jgi:hypothetical protein
MAKYYTSRFSDIFEILQSKGVVELSKAIKRYFFGHIQRWFQEKKWGESYPDHLSLIYADPNDVKYYLLQSRQTDYHFDQEIEHPVLDVDELDRARFRVRVNTGKIIGGDWDQNKREWENLSIFQSLQAVFKKNREWENTKFIKSCLEKIDNGYNCYGYGTKNEFLENRCEYIDSLYTNMCENGYKTQEELKDDHRSKDILHEVSVNIGRDGELIFNNETGHHRLSLAKILDLPEIPMLVVVRHQKWQRLRDEIQKKGLHERHKSLRNHPDLKDVLAE